MLQYFVRYRQASDSGSSIVDLVSFRPWIDEQQAEFCLTNQEKCCQQVGQERNSGPQEELQGDPVARSKSNPDTA